MDINCTRNARLTNITIRQGKVKTRDINTTMKQQGKIKQKVYVLQSTRFSWNNWITGIAQSAKDTDVIYALQGKLKVNEIVIIKSFNRQRKRKM